MNTTLILDFLSDLKENNHREWMEENRTRYQEAKEEFIQIVAKLIEEIQKFDPSLTSITPKESIFRLNRDIRFSKNKTPYKTNFGASMAKGGRKSNYASYYIHIDPENSFTGGGIYMPPANILKKIRQEIDYNSEDFQNILRDKNFKKIFGEINGERLKTAPKGYPKDHPQIELLRLKSFTAITKFSYEEVTQDGFMPKAVESLRHLKGLNGFLNMAVRDEES